MLLHEDITEKIIQCFYKVYNQLGFGFLEKVYENDMLIELANAGLICARQVPVNVYYAEQVVGNYFADIMVEGKVILELKAGDGILIAEHELQLINYLKATNIEVGLLLHFGKNQYSSERYLQILAFKISENQPHSCHQRSIKKSSSLARLTHCGAAE